MKTKQQIKDSETLFKIALIALFVLTHLIIINQYIFKLWT